ncbi:T9SS type A sorting domain-containing protein [Membranihabitans maritimus]|uniref:T9SS type A sorting domain-containing protein n=1 Tax=Membranihabitans maritimus TaxID=2904244 RepID=UPI001F3BB87C|nr:T9SS type A sorting domain-containing protein [Membranihabitans maritimus]
MNFRMQLIRYCLAFLWLGGAIPLSAQYSDTQHRSLKEGEIPVSEPGYYGAPGATYVLVNDIKSNMSPIFLGNNVTLDLNGYEIVYADGDYEHVPNYGFEDGLSSWDLSDAPEAQLVDNKVQVFIGDSALSLVQGEEITSKFVQLPVADRSYFAMCGVASNTMKVSVFVENEKGEIVYSNNPYGNDIMQGCPVENKHPQLGGGFVYAHFQGKSTGKYRVRIRAETDAIVDQIDIRPALDVGVGIVERTFTNTHTDHMYAGWYDPAFYDYTEDFGDGNPIEGVPVVQRGEEGTIIIKNGTIRSGARGILSWGIQSTATKIDLNIDNVKIVSSGINTNAIEVIAANISNCYFDVETPFIINRHNSGNYAVDLRGTQSSEVSHSEFYGGQGCLSYRGNGSKIHDNLFVNRQTVTNHYSIGTGGRFSEIYRNVFKPELGSGIGVGGRDIKIYDNEIHIEAAPPTCEYGHEDYSVNGIRLADYNAPPGDPDGCYDNQIYDNKFFITGKDYPEYPDYIPVATAIFYSASGGDNFIYDNEVLVDALDPDSKARTSAFYVGGGTIGGIFENNTIETNVPAFWLGSPYGDAAQTKIIENTIVQTPNALDNYAPVRLGSGGNLATDIEFISNNIEGRDSILNFDATRRQHTYSVLWSLEISTKDTEGLPIFGQRIKIYDNEDNLVVDSTTGNSGVLKVVLKEYEYYNRLVHNKHPYRVVVGGQESNIRLKRDRQLIVLLDEISGSKEQYLTEFSYGPNPADSALNLNFSNTIERRIKLLDSNNKTCLQKVVRGNKVKLDISSFPSGSYFLQVVEGEKIITEKILIH